MAISKIQTGPLDEAIIRKEGGFIIRTSELKIEISEREIFSLIGFFRFSPDGRMSLIKIIFPLLDLRHMQKDKAPIILDR